MGDPTANTMSAVYVFDTFFRATALYIAKNFSIKYRIVMTRPNMNAAMIGFMVVETFSSIASDREHYPTLTKKNPILYAHGATLGGNGSVWHLAAR